VLPIRQGGWHHQGARLGAARASLLLAVSFANDLDGAGLVDVRYSFVQLAVTHDGGKSWQAAGGLLPGFPASPSSSIAPSQSIAWTSPTGGYAWDSTELLQISDGGRHWRRIPSPTALATPTLTFVSALGDTLWASFDCRSSTSGCAKPLWSWNAGSGWQAIPIPVGSAGAFVTDIVRTSAGTDLVLIDTIADGDLADTGGSLLESRDGGSAWTRRPVPCGSLTVRGSHGNSEMTPGAGSVALASAGQDSGTTIALECLGGGGAGFQALSFWSLSSMAPGNIWHLQSDNLAGYSGGRLPDVSSAPRSGYAADLAQTPGTLWLALGRSVPYRSTDDGRIWHEVPAMVSAGAGGGGSIDFVDPEHGWCLYHGVGLWSTSDGGQTWRLLPSS